LGLVGPARAIAKRGYYPCLEERVSMLNSKRQALVITGISIAFSFVSETWTVARSYETDNRWHIVFRCWQTVEG
jgi:hypothetical protein